MRNFKWTFASLIALLIGCHSNATRQAPPGHDGTTVTRAYEVRDLIIEIPNFIPEATTQPTRNRDELVRELITGITSSIDPLSWCENTGSFGSINETEGQLLITQTPRNHALILNKLSKMREKTRVQITIETRFISNAPQLERELTRDGDEWIKLHKSGADLCPRFFSEAEAQELLRPALRDADTTLITAPRITLFDSQRAYIRMSRETAYVGDLHRSGDKIEPDIKIAESGMLVGCQAKVSADKKLVTLNLHPRLSTLVDMRAEPWPGGKDHTIQVAEMLVRETNATITMPDQQTAVYRIHARRISATQPANDPPVFMLVRPRIVSQRENSEKQLPLLDRGG